MLSLSPQVFDRGKTKDLDCSGRKPLRSSQVFDRGNAKDLLKFEELSMRENRADFSPEESSDIPSAVSLSICKARLKGFDLAFVLTMCENCAELSGVDSSADRLPVELNSAIPEGVELNSAIPGGG
jgi:hypothetical protein